MEKSNYQLRSFARIVGIAGILVFILFLFMYVFPPSLEKADVNYNSDFAFLGFLIVGYIFAWHREYEGGIMLMFLSALAGLSYYYNENSLPLFINLSVCIPLFISGLLFYIYHRELTKKSG